MAEQQKQFEARLDQQAAAIQRVNDRIELIRPVPRVVAGTP
jgi:hypothetical protein